MMLAHVTLFKHGTIVMHRMDTFDADAVAACAKLLPRGGLVPAFPAYRVEIHGPVFTIWRGRDPLVTCGVGQGEDETWLTLWEMQARFSSVQHGEAPPGWWLAVVILPGLIMMPREDIFWLADFERCLAAAMIQQHEH